MRAHEPTARGEDRLVPPTRVAAPFTKMFAAQIARKLPPAHMDTSGKPRPVPAADPSELGTIGRVPEPVKACQNGADSKRLGPPPPASQPVSKSYVKSAFVNRLVPPTAITYGDEAG